MKLSLLLSLDAAIHQTATFAGSEEIDSPEDASL